MPVLRLGKRPGLRTVTFAVAALSVAIAAVPAANASAPVPGNAVRMAAPKSFRISGHVTGLFPGAALPLEVTVTNPFHFAIVVTSISAVAGEGPPGCAASNLKLSTFSGHLEVGAGQVGHTTLEVTLAHSAPDACQGAVFLLTYSGSARKA